MPMPGLGLSPSGRLGLIHATSLLSGATAVSNRVAVDATGSPNVYVSGSFTTASLTTPTLTKIGERTLHWACKARNAVTGAPVTEGKATRVYARINEDGTLNSAVIPDAMRKAMLQSGQLSHLRQNIEKEPEYHHPTPAARRRKKA